MDNEELKMKDEKLKVDTANSQFSIGHYPLMKDSGIEWIGEIPEHWDKKRLKYKTTFQKGKNPQNLKTIVAADSLIYLSMEYLRNNPKQVYYVEDYENYLVVNDDEILLLWDGSNAGEFIKSKKGVLSSTMAVLYLNNYNNIYAYYFFKTLEPTLKDFTIGMGVPHVNGDELKNSIAILPPPEEQTAIANFLDRKTAEIDELIAKKERLLELYEEEKSAVINSAVTGRILMDNGQLTIDNYPLSINNCQFKESGIEWLGRIPAHWEVKKLKYVAKILRGKFTHRPRNDERLYNGKYPFIQTSEVTNSTKYIKTYRQTLNNMGYSISQEFPSGTLVMTIAANIGDVAILNFDACFPDSIIGFYPNKKIVVDFLYYKLLSLKQHLLGIATQNTQQNLNIDRIAPIEISFPKAIEEQTAIVAYIEKERAGIDAKIAKTKKLIELLKEYRAALISEAVTGKIKVVDGSI